MTKLVQDLKVGDVIMPPAREVQLWMRRHCRENGLSDAALHLTITSIKEASPDKRGRWVQITTDQSDEWYNGRPPYPFRFKARPETPWQMATPETPTAPQPTALRLEATRSFIQD